MSGVLYVIATPIGNLSDLTLRASQTLSEVHFIAAEDTRVTLKLLNHLDIKKPLISYNKHNATAKGAAILERILSGESCALCSDAGTPAISDPGEYLVRDALKAGIQVVPIPAACAAIAALSVSGQVTGRFVFEGFITQNKRLRSQRILQLASEERTLVIYEAPHKLSSTLDALTDAFGADRPLTVCRELTKLHEEIWPTTLGEASVHYHANTPRGEFVLVIAGAEPLPDIVYTPLEAAQMAHALASREHLSASEAAKRIASETKLAKSIIYKQMQITLPEENL